MIHWFRLLLIVGLFLVVIPLFGAGAAFAVELPGPADINRIAPNQPPLSPPALSNGQVIKIPEAANAEPAVPANAKKIHFILHGFHFERVTVFTSKQLKDLYRPYIGKKVTLDIAWKIAAALTDKYREKGYFLSRAFVPAQEVIKGTLKIVAIEGFISDVSTTGDTPPQSPIIDKIINDIEADKPVRIKTLEHQLLLLDDLPGYSFKATLVPSKTEDKAAVGLVLKVEKTKGTTTLSFNNSGSRYMGPNEISADWDGSMLPLQGTDLSLTSAPAVHSTDGQVYAFNATHKIPLAPAIGLDLTGGYSTAVPGYTLKPENITSQSTNGGIGISYHVIRQRDENLTTRVSMDFRDSETNIMNTPLFRDYIRAVQFGINYDRADSWAGHNYLDLELRHGLPILGSSGPNDPDTTKPDVHPDFTKLVATYTRLQNLVKDWTSSLILSGQKASGTLYSSEEFGYGGTAIGRAYDSSEITGDNGISGSLELHYLGLPQGHQTTLTPYLFYDIGKTWDLYPSEPEQISGASAGPGINIQYTKSLSGDFYIAEPLTKGIDTPLYGDNHKNPRYSFKLDYKFQ